MQPAHPFCYRACLLVLYIMSSVITKAEAHLYSSLQVEYWLQWWPDEWPSLTSLQGLNESLVNITLTTEHADLNRNMWISSYTLSTPGHLLGILWCLWLIHVWPLWQCCISFILVSSGYCDKEKCPGHICWWIVTPTNQYWHWHRIEV